MALSALMAGAAVSAEGADPFAGMPEPEAMEAPQSANQVNYTVGEPRVRINGPRRLYRFEAGQVSRIRLVNFGLAVFRAGSQLGSFGGRSYVQIASGRWSGWWVKAPVAAPSLTDRYAAHEVELSAGVHSGVRFYAGGSVRVRRPLYVANATSFSVSRRATFDGRDYYLVKNGPLADRWVPAWKGATLVSAAAQVNENTADSTPRPTSAPDGSTPKPTTAPTTHPAPTSQPRPTATPAPTNAPTPAPTPAASWKGIVLVYSETDVTYTRADGTDYHMTSRMSGEMHDLVLNTAQRFGRAVKNWSNGLVTMDLDIVQVPHAVTALDRLGDGYWLGPRSVRDDLDRYAPDGEYDSIFVVWKARDDVEKIPVGGWGLTLPPGSWANGAGYSSIITPSELWWWTDSNNPEEVFVHEWMHQVLYWQEQHERLSLDLHSGAKYGYESVNGTWKRWLADVMQGKVRDGNGFTGVNREMWAADQPTEP